MASSTKRRTRGTRATSSKRKRKLSVTDTRPDFLSSKYAEPPVHKIYNNRHQKNSPAELFRKDLISAMKMSDSEHLSPKEFWVIEDPWRSEWEKGVQVPVRPDELPEAKIRVLRKRNKNLNFKLPKKLIHTSRDNVYNPDVHIILRRNKKWYYDLDDADLRWLTIINQDREDYGLQPIEESVFEQIIEELEIRCFINFQEAIKGDEFSTEGDDDTICDICRSPESHEENEMVFCDVCNIGVHQICYGIPQIPEGSWVCQTCELEISPECVLCPNLGGAMKVTSGKDWAHVGCAVWIPEVSFDDFSTMEPIIKISHVPSNRWNLVCSLCQEKKGACILCYEKSCKTAFHVTCAFREGLIMRAIVRNSRSDDDALKPYCLKHSQKHKAVASDSELEDNEVKKESLTKEEKEIIWRKKIQEREAEFYNYVNINDVAENVSFEKADVESVYHYWVLKRKSNHNRPFLPPITDLDDYYVKEDDSFLVQRFITLRQQLERVRNLTYMTCKREKLTKDWHLSKCNIFEKQNNILTKHSKKFTKDELEAVVSANSGSIEYDKKYSGDNGPSPNVMKVLTTLIGEEVTKLQLNGLMKPHKKNNDRPKAERTPNPYAKHYLNGLAKRTQRWFTSVDGLRQESPLPNNVPKDSLRRKRSLSSSFSSDHQNDDGHDASATLGNQPSSSSPYARSKSGKTLSKQMSNIKPSVIDRSDFKNNPSNLKSFSGVKRIGENPSCGESTVDQFSLNLKQQLISKDDYMGKHIRNPAVLLYNLSEKEHCTAVEKSNFENSENVCMQANYSRKLRNRQSNRSVCVKVLGGSDNEESHSSPSSSSRFNSNCTKEIINDTCNSEFYLDTIDGNNVVHDKIDVVIRQDVIYPSFDVENNSMKEEANSSIAIVNVQELMSDNNKLHSELVNKVKQQLPLNSNLCNISQVNNNKHVNKMLSKAQRVSCLNNDIKTSKISPKHNSDDRSSVQRSALSRAKSNVSVQQKSSVNKSSSLSKCQVKSSSKQSPENDSSGLKEDSSQNSDVSDIPIPKKNVLRGYKIPKKTKTEPKEEESKVDSKGGNSPLSPFPDVRARDTSGYQNRVVSATVTATVTVATITAAAAATTTTITTTTTAPAPASALAPAPTFQPRIPQGTCSWRKLEPRSTTTVKTEQQYQFNSNSRMLRHHDSKPVYNNNNNANESVPDSRWKVTNYHHGNNNNQRWYGNNNYQNSFPRMPYPARPQRQHWPRTRNHNQFPPVHLSYGQGFSYT